MAEEPQKPEKPQKAAPLTVNIEQVTPVEKKLSIEVSAEVIQKEMELAYDSLRRSVRVPGFRPGKVPQRILEQRYREQIEDQVTKKVTDRWYLEALEINSVDAVSSPSIVLESRVKKGAPFKFQARVQVRPVLDPKDYSGLELHRREVVVADEQVNKRMEDIRQRMARLEKVSDRDVARAGDFLTVDYVATTGGAEFPGGKAEGVNVEVAPGELIHSKCAALEGVKVGETRTIDYAFPADYQVEAVKGKTARFQITVKEIKTQVTPPLDDAFAKEIGGGETVAEMREKVRNDLLAAERTKVRQADREEVMAEVLKRNPFDLPPAMVDRAVDSMIQAALLRLARSGVDPAQLNLDVDALRRELRGKAEAEVKGTLALEAIGRKEGLDVGEPDVEAKVQELAKDSGKAPERVRQEIEDPGAKRQFYEKLREEKTIEFLKARAKYS